MRPSVPITSLTLSFVGTCQAATRVFDWNVSWVSANPSGQHERKVVGINDQWPLPQVNVNKGDRVIFNVYNGLKDKSTAIHFHGLYQNKTNSMDGAGFVNQCPIPPGANFTYDFTAEQNGTYWYHSHVSGQYPDGYRAPFIVHDEHAYFTDMYDEELTFTLSDWYDDLMDDLDKQFMNPNNPSGAEPVPQYLIFNESMNVSVAVKPNTTYLLHIMNIGALGNIYLWFEDHDFTIVEIDGVYVKPTKAEKLFLTPAQRYAVLLKTKEYMDKNYAIVSVFDSDSFDSLENCKTLNTTNWLEYNKSAPHDYYEIPFKSSNDIEAVDDMDLVPFDDAELYPNPDVEFTLNVSMNNLADGINYAFFNNVTYNTPKVPSLYTLLSAPESMINNPKIYGEQTNPLVFEHMQTVQIVINNNDPGSHPFHMHGHNFQVIHRSKKSSNNLPAPFDSKNDNDFPAVPMRRDTAHVNAMGSLVLRFVADNPGVWFFHCHVEWHLSQGLAAILVEAPQQVLKTVKVPEAHYEMCRLGNTPYIGNAAANVSDSLDLRGKNSQAPYMPEGFTTLTVLAALLFMCLAIFGMYFLGKYGVFDFKKSRTKYETLEEENELSEHFAHP